MTLTTRSDIISLALHRELAERLRTEPLFVITRALQNVPRKRELATGGSRAAIDRWDSLLHRSDVDGLRLVFIGEDEDSRMMRNSTVFQGVLDPGEREKVLAGIPHAP